MIALGSNAHIFARPARREDLIRCFEAIVGANAARLIEYPGIDEPMLLVTFPGGGHLSVEFTEEAPDDEKPRLGAWLELRADDPAAMLRGALDAGLVEVNTPAIRTTS